jgi:anti-sigma-K factor RskA
VDVTARPTGCGEDVAAYALGALDEESAGRFEQHLEGCDLCRADLASLKPVVDRLPASAEPVDPPPELRKRIMSVVEADAKRLRGAEAPERRGAWRTRWVPAVAAAAAAAAIAVVLVTGGGAETETIRAQGDMPGAQSTLRVEDDAATLVVQGMPKPPAGRVYQVWKQHRNGPPQPTDALFTPAGDGAAEVTVPGDLEGVEQVLVSHEPRGGSRRPTSAAGIVIRL